ncbi:MAG: hypothetical protein EAS49_13645 [Brucella intermedia]|nr:MAG: hypothetical protein EAS49_13645 [Brucella intermedia]
MRKGTNKTRKYRLCRSSAIFIIKTPGKRAAGMPATQIQKLAADYRQKGITKPYQGQAVDNSIA